ncbi:MAG: hypothetical protein B7Z55_01525 [Planctomycetales bacterium 12-60-4]|nr:MAG: hypothetical protein B7Z55_01525 [Planctomycetales bacterium 12-60-4]
MSSAPSATGATSQSLGSGLLERKLDDWALLIRADVEPGQFFREWLALAVHTARADVAAVWLKGNEQQWTRLALSIANADGQPEREGIESPPDAIVKCLSADDPQVSRLKLDGATVTQGTCRIRQGGQPVGVLEAQWPTDLFQSSQSALMPFLGASGELTGDFLVQHELRHLRREHAQWRQWEQFVASAQAQPTLIALAQQIVHDGRGLTGSERLNVLRSRGGHWQVVAVSGVDSIDPRSSSVQAFENLARTLANTRSDGVVNERLPAAEERVRQATGATALQAFPLLASDGVAVGALICERFDQPGDTAAWQQRCRSLQHFATAPWVALTEAEQGFWSRWWRKSTRRWGRHSVSTLAGLIRAGGLAAVLTLTPALLQITAEGTLLPAVRRDVFAGTSGIVSAVLVDHGSPVSHGQTLMELRDPEADLEATRIAGELATVQARLSVVQAARVSAITSATDGAAQSQQLAGEEAELKQRQESLVALQTLLEQERLATRVTSPIAGEVLTWDASALLSGRPVERGQVLLTVGDVAGPWIVEAHVRERDLPELSRAQSASDSELTVEFTPSATMSRTYKGRLIEVARVSDVNERGDTTVRVTIAFDRDPTDKLRPGATVLPKIHCGEQSLGYVWFREVFHAVRRQWWLWW